MATDGDQGTLFLTREEKSSALLMANFGDLSGMHTRARHIKELCWQLEMLPVNREGTITVSRDVLRMRFYWNSGISARVFDATRKAAEDLGIITVGRSPNKTGGQGVNHYQVKWSTIQKFGHPSTAATRSQVPTSPQVATSCNALSPQAAPQTEPQTTPAPRDEPPLPEGVGASTGRSRRLYRRGEAPMHSGGGHIEETIPSTISKTHDGGNGDQRSGKNGGRWPPEISTQELSRRGPVARLFRVAVNQGWIEDTEREMIRFFAMALYCRRKGKVPGAMFTYNVKNGLWDRITDADEDRARTVVREILHPKPAASILDLPSIDEGDLTKSAAEQLAQLRKLQLAEAHR